MLGGPDSAVLLTADDYLLGVFDMTGELMRFAITTMATTGELPGFQKSTSKDASSGEAAMEEGTSQLKQSVLDDLRELRSYLEPMTSDHDPYMSKQLSQKLPVMKQCVEKVENAVYGLIVRGSERPKGWMPESGPSGREEVESY